MPAASSRPRSLPSNLGWCCAERCTGTTISIGQCGVPLMRQPETPLCTVYERGRVVGLVLDRGVVGSKAYVADEGPLACLTPGTALFRPCGNSGRTLTCRLGSQNV